MEQACSEWRDALKADDAVWHALATAHFPRIRTILKALPNPHPSYRIMYKTQHLAISSYRSSILGLPKTCPCHYVVSIELLFKGEVKLSCTLDWTQSPEFSLLSTPQWDNEEGMPDFLRADGAHDKLAARAFVTRVRDLSTVELYHGGFCECDTQAAADGQLHFGIEPLPLVEAAGMYKEFFFNENRPDLLVHALLELGTGSFELLLQTEEGTEEDDSCTEFWTRDALNYLEHLAPWN